MEFKATKLLLATVQPEVEISHKGEVVSFIVSSFGRANFTQEFDIFQHLNTYLLTMTEQELDFIFSIYVKIRNEFDYAFNKTDLVLRVNSLAIQLTTAINLDRVHDWVLFKSDIIVPSTIEAEYTYSVDRQGSREQTFTRSDYNKLIALTIVVRSMIPVWGEFIYQTKKDSGNLFKEFYALQLLNNAPIMHSPPMEKLNVYIEHAVGKDKFGAASIIGGISSEDFPFWMLALVIIRRLCTGDIRGLDPMANIITYIYTFVVQKIQPSDISAENNIKEKTTFSQDSTMDDKISTLERYRIRHNISIGEIVELAFSIRDLHSIARRLSPSISPELVDRSIASAQQLMAAELLEPQTTLLGWVFKPVISPNGFLYLDKSIVVNCLGVLQAILINNNFSYLALLATGFANIGDEEVYLSSTESRARLLKEQVARLDELYPFQQTSGAKKAQGKSINPAIIAIDNITDGFSMYSWSITADTELVEKILGNRNTRRIGIPYDIKIQLANLVMAIGSRTLI